jgi:hypothetical protein
MPVSGYHGAARKSINAGLAPASKPVSSLTRGRAVCQQNTGDV